MEGNKQHFQQIRKEHFICRKVKMKLKNKAYGEEIVNDQSFPKKICDVLIVEVFPQLV